MALWPKFSSWLKVPALNKVQTHKPPGGHQNSALTGMQIIYLFLLQYKAETRSFARSDDGKCEAVTQGRRLRQAHDHTSASPSHALGRNGLIGSRMEGGSRPCTALLKRVREDGRQTEVGVEKRNTHNHENDYVMTYLDGMNIGMFSVLGLFILFCVYVGSGFDTYD